MNSELPPHPNVVHLFGVSLDGPQPVIVMEYCEGGTKTERKGESVCVRKHNRKRKRVCVSMWNVFLSFSLFSCISHISLSLSFFFYYKLIMIREFGQVIV
jgi:serine/threonine protein kinase